MRTVIPLEEEVCGHFITFPRRLRRLFDEKVIEEIASSNDIVDVISSYIPLKREGRNYSALCPFHREKTPSFKVFPDSQRYKCFGCGKSGNVFLFVMEMEKLTFPESMEFLAKAAGITLEKKGRPSGRNVREICFKLNNVAQEYFRRNIKSSEGKVATTYILSRGFTPALLREFGLGYSLPDWTGLLDFARKKGIAPKDLEDAGLAVMKERGTYYDRFRGRLMFPIFDIQGRICGFGARSIDGSMPKYLNSPETPVFSKSKMRLTTLLCIPTSSALSYFLLYTGHGSLALFLCETVHAVPGLSGTRGWIFFKRFAPKDVDLGRGRLSIRHSFQF